MHPWSTTVSPSNGDRAYTCLESWFCSKQSLFCACVLHGVRIFKVEKLVRAERFVHNDDERFPFCAVLQERSRHAGNGSMWIRGETDCRHKSICHLPLPTIYMTARRQMFDMSRKWRLKPPIELGMKVALIDESTRF